MYHPHEISHVLPMIGHDDVLDALERLIGVTALTVECSREDVPVLTEEAAGRFECVDIAFERAPIAAFGADEHDEIAIIEPDLLVFNDVRPGRCLITLRRHLANENEVHVNKEAQ